ncbi:hypothetical protein [Roseateles terrae]|uniref:DUF4304 domain-containing protein n=1 Tax=Roseateles terrae TaxID=431060 RepID=A0ABR6GP64_9BURK|nr:hypothetical protein [Roseateles terrae]MBB3193892.1 hypothetical protein [Roseateles terrae]OWQ87774.1 hypothetical protein CDN98_06305 [Roseateles terrae]
MTATYANSKAVHGALKRLLSPWFIQNGWKRRPGYACAFLRSSASGQWCLWVQVNSWGGSLSGSSFTLNLIRLEGGDAELITGPDSRVLLTLTDAEKGEAFCIAQELATRIPDPAATHAVHQWAQLPGYEGEQWRQRLADLRMVNPDAWAPGVDVWLPYYAVEDLEAWVTFLLPRLQRLLNATDNTAIAGQ